MMHWTTSLRVTKCSAVRSQTARPSRLTKGFFSLSRKREDCPAAGRMTANLAMAGLPERDLTNFMPGVILRALCPNRQLSPACFRAAEPGAQSVLPAIEVMVQIGQGRLFALRPCGKSGQLFVKLGKIKRPGDWSERGRHG